MAQRARKPAVWTALALAGAASLLATGPATASPAPRCAGDEAVLAASNQPQVEMALLCLTNAYRLQWGLVPLQMDSRLGRAARAHSADMVARGFFDHFDPDGLGPDERARAAGYPDEAGENIAANSEGTAISLFRQWRESAPHDDNMLVPEYRSAGMGVVLGVAEEDPELGITGTQMFGLLRGDSAENGLALYSGGDACIQSQLRKIRLARKLKRTGRRGVEKKLKKVKRRIKRVCAQA
jgi:uncharacterized protein YkwD